MNTQYLLIRKIMSKIMSKINNFKDGDVVYYHPIVGRDEKYMGIVDGDPWKLGTGENVCNINIVDKSYPYKRKRIIEDDSNDERQIHLIMEANTLIDKKRMNLVAKNDNRKEIK